MLLQLYKTLNNLTLPEQFCIPFPKPAGALTLALPGAIFPKFGKNKFGTAKVQLCPDFQEAVKIPVRICEDVVYLLIGGVVILLSFKIVFFQIILQNLRHSSFKSSDDLNYNLESYSLIR